MTKEYSMKAGAVIVAAGEGSRMGMGGEKLFTRVGGVPLLALTLKAYQGHPGIGPIVLVASKEVQKRFDRELRRHYGLSKVVAVVAGGRRRQDSVYKGLLAFPSLPRQFLSTMETVLLLTIRLSRPYWRVPRMEARSPRSGPKIRSSG